jgi:site-specific DNA recombinase
MAKKLRAVLYARYSTDKQKPTSIDDQLNLARGRAVREGFEVVGIYSDAAKVGGTTEGRDGLYDLIQAAYSRQFDAVFAESMDRLSRSQADTFRLFNQLTFLNVQIWTLSDGQMDELKLGLQGIIASHFNKGLAQKVRRGQVGMVNRGKVPTGVAYGYRTVPGKPGEREIDPAQADIVRRIFRQYSCGVSPRTIVQQLNAEGIPAPGRTPWTIQNVAVTTTALGAKGLLGNRIYLGEIHFGRAKVVRNPDTGRLVRRKGDEEPIVVLAPHLRIVDDELWNAVQNVRLTRLKPKGVKAVWQRSDGLLSGVARCGCGSTMILAQRDRSGCGRFKCSDAHFGKGCQHTKSYSATRLESAVIEALLKVLGDRDLTLSFVEEYQADLRSRQRGARAERDSIKRQLIEIEAKIGRLIHALENDLMPSEQITARLQALSVEKVGLTERARLAEQETNIVDLHPKALEYYRKAVATLQADLRRKADRPDSRIAFRNLVESVTVKETRPRAPYEIKINGRLGALLGIILYPEVATPAQIVTQQGSRVALDCNDSRYPRNEG